MSTEAEDTPVARETEPEGWRRMEIALRDALVAAGAVAVGADDAILLTMAEQVVGTLRAAVGGGDLASLAERLGALEADVVELKHASWGRTLGEHRERLDDVSGWQEGILRRLASLEAAAGERYERWLTPDGLEIMRSNHGDPFCLRRAAPGRTRVFIIVPPEGGGGKDGRNDEQHERDVGLAGDGEPLAPAEAVAPPAPAQAGAGEARKP